MPADNAGVKTLLHVHTYSAKSTIWIFKSLKLCNLHSNFFNESSPVLWTWYSTCKDDLTGLSLVLCLFEYILVILILHVYMLFGMHTLARCSLCPIGVFVQECASLSLLSDPPKLGILFKHWWKLLLNHTGEIHLSGHRTVSRVRLESSTSTPTITQHQRSQTIQTNYKMFLLHPIFANQLLLLINISYLWQ